MIPFQKILPTQFWQYAPYLNLEENCEYAFVNLCIWGNQQAAPVDDQLVIFSRLDQQPVYLFPAGNGQCKNALDAILHDAKMRGICCRVAGMSQEKCQLLERFYPGKFRFFTNRNNFDYVYKIDDLVDLKGRAFQKKRNHLNQFRKTFPHCKTMPISLTHLSAVEQFANEWYDKRKGSISNEDYHLEKQALAKALQNFQVLPLEGLLLMDGDRILAFALGSPLTNNTFDIHFEKALDEAEGAYAAINHAFAAYLQQMHPHLQFLNREEDMGIEGLRQAKRSYHPHHLAEKHWAVWRSDDDV